MLKLTEITRRSTTGVTVSSILLNRHAMAKVEKAPDDAEHGPCVRILSDEAPTMTCKGSVDELHEQIRKIEARESGDPEATADAVAGLVALVEALAARVEELEKKQSSSLTMKDLEPLAATGKLAG